MNNIILKGLLRNIEYSHTIDGVEYNKAQLLCSRDKGREDVINLRFKKFSNPYEDGKEISLIGNVRSFSEQLENGKNKVNVYVFTYMDMPPTKEYTDDSQEEITNALEIDGRICKIGNLEKTPKGKTNLHFILANNIIVNDKQKLNSYLPCVAWGRLATEMANLKVSDKIEIFGELHSREYKKQLDNGEMEIRVAHEIVVLDYKLV